MTLQELDFLHEGENADRCRQNFNSKKSKVRQRIHIPKIYHNKSSKRVLTMEYINGEAKLKIGRITTWNNGHSSFSPVISISVGSSRKLSFAKTRSHGPVE